MTSVGNILQSAREKAGLTLEDISATTRIPVRTLRALEGDDLAQIASAFFYRSFARQFAAAVHADFKVISARVDEAAASFPEPFTPGKMRTILQRTLVSPPRRWTWKIPVAVTAFTAVMAACTFFYSVWEGDGKGEHVANLRGGLAQLVAHFGLLPAPAASHSDPRPSATPMPVPSAEPPAPAPSSPAPSAESHDSLESEATAFHAELSAIEPSWLSIVTDGHPVFQGILAPNEKKIVEGQQSGQVRTGNAGGLSLVFNGQPVGLMGPRGQIRVAVFRRDGYRVLKGAPVTASLLPHPLQFSLVARAELPGLESASFHHDPAR